MEPPSHAGGDFVVCLQATASDGGGAYKFRLSAAIHAQMYAETLVSVAGCLGWITVAESISRDTHASDLRVDFVLVKP